MEKKLNIRTLIQLVFVVLISLCFVYCDDIIEIDMAKRQVQLVSPGDNISTTVVSQNFIWETVKGAKSYHIQIASPSFEKAEQMVVNAVLDSNVFTYTIFPGKFQWRVCAINSSSESPYTTRSFIIIDTKDLTDQVIMTVSPQSSYIGRNSTIQFSWQKLYNADSYDLLIKNLTDGSILYPNLSTENDTLSKSIPEGKYEWSVRGYNKTSSTYSRYSNVSSIIIDNTAPGVAVLKSPANRSIQTAYDVTFKWNKPTDKLTSVEDSLFVSTDSLFNAKPEVAIKTTKDIATYNYTFTASGKYFWRVKSVDQAGNQSNYSSFWSITVQP